MIPAGRLREILAGGDHMGNRIARNLAQCKPRTLFVGIDIGKRHNAVCIMGWNARVMTNFIMENSREGFNLLIRRVREWKEGTRAEAILFGCEPAGHYWRPLAYFLKSERFPFRLVSPFTIRCYREGIDLARNKRDPAGCHNDRRTPTHWEIPGIMFAPGSIC